MTAEQARQFIKPGDSIRPCSHLHSSWLSGTLQLKTFWEKLPSQPYWYVGCEMCFSDATTRKMEFHSVIDETRGNIEEPTPI